LKSTRESLPAPSLSPEEEEEILRHRQEDEEWFEQFRAREEEARKPIPQAVLKDGKPRMDEGGILIVREDMWDLTFEIPAVRPKTVVFVHGPVTSIIQDAGKETSHTRPAEMGDTYDWGNFVRLHD
jgi:hypothetical protein